MRIALLISILAFGCGGGVGGQRGGPPDNAGEGQGSGDQGGSPGGDQGVGGDAEGGPGGQGGGGPEGGGVGAEGGGGAEGGQQGDEGGGQQGGQEGGEGGADEGGGQLGDEGGGQQGDEGGGQQGDEGGGQQGDEGGGQQGDEGGGDEGGDEGGVDAGPRPAENLTGVVNVTQIYVRTLSDEPFLGNGGAFFTETGAPPEGGGCQIVNDAAAEPTPSAHAGVIRVTGGSRELTLTPTRQADGTWVYESNLPQSNKILYDAGDTLTFTGAGGPHVGAFRYDLEAPDRVDIREPSPPFNMPNRGGAVRVRWNGRDEVAALITLVPARGDPFPTDPIPGVSILCATEDDGDETIPAQLMGQLPRSDGFILGVSRIRVAEYDLDADTHLVLTAVMSGGMVSGFN